MANRVDVLRDVAPHIGENTTRRVPILDEDDVALPLAGLDLHVFIARQAGGTKLLEYDSGDGITVEDTSYMAIEFGEDDFTDAEMRPGPYYWEGWDMTDNLMFFYGDFWVLAGSPEAA